MSAHQPHRGGVGRVPVPAVRHAPVRLYLGGAHDVLAAMADSVDRLTSPTSAWSLRDYGPGRNLPEFPRWLAALTERCPQPQCHPSE